MAKMGLTFLALIVSAAVARSQVQGPKPSDAPTSLTFRQAAIAPGDQIDSVMAMEMPLTMDVLANGRSVAPTISMINRQTKRDRATCLAAKDGRITRARIDYLERKEYSKTPNGEETTEGDLDGEAVMVSVSGDVLNVADADGGEIDEEVRSAVKDEIKVRNGAIDRSDPICRALAAKPIKVGEVVNLQADAAREFLGDDDAILGGEVAFKLVEAITIRGRAAGVFEVQLKATGRSDPTENVPPLNITFSLKGRVIVAADTSELLEVVLGGVVTMNGEMDVAGSGRVSMVGNGTAKLTGSEIIKRAP